MKDVLRKLKGWMVWDALAWLAIALYELCTRLDAMSGPLRMFVNMAVGEGIPLARAARYVDWGIFTVPLYLALCMASAILALCLRRTKAGPFVLAPVALALFLWGLGLDLSLPGQLFRFVYVAPALIMALLCAGALLCRAPWKRARAGGEAAPDAQAGEAPYRRAS